MAHAERCRPAGQRAAGAHAGARAAPDAALSFSDSAAHHTAEKGARGGPWTRPWELGVTWDDVSFSWKTAPKQPAWRQSINDIR